MDYRLTNRIVAGLVFLVSLIVFLSTVQPSTSFWDCGEFIAAAVSMQVPHPPGTPGFLIVGRVFSMIPLVENVGLRVNLISVFSSAFSVLFLYLVAVKLIEAYRGKPKNLVEGLTTIIASATGALAFAFSDTFWFNAVEAEVYAASLFLFAASAYFMMRWNERADIPGSERYLILIFYLLGFSAGVHLMAVLAALPVVMVVYFRKYIEDDEQLKQTAYILLAHVGALLLIAMVMWAGETDSQPPTQEYFNDFDSKMKIIFVVVSIGVVIGFWKRLVARNSIYIPMVVGSIALAIIYPGYVKVLPTFIESIAHESSTTALFIIALVMGGMGYGAYYAYKKRKALMHTAFLAFLFAFLGFTTYTMVIIRANMDTPLNMNTPKTYTELLSYLNREQYGDFPTFKRRFATEPHQMVVYQNYDSDLEFWWRYQMNHMMTRYLLWNFAGRASWYQEDGANVAPFNSVAEVIARPLGLKFGGPVATSLWALPLLLGVFGAYHHFRRDWKMATVFMLLFVLMGYLTAYYQNQQQPQPRERDYFYVGAFFVFGVWIALGARGLVELATEKAKNEKTRTVFAAVILALAFVAAPVRMLQANYHTHDRSENWAPWDYAYNLLQTCAPNSVLFTNGDNDTFPLWYLQDVEGIRRDVRIANLSLVNTHWYIKQLKNQAPYGSEPVKMRWTDAQIDQLIPVRWEPRKMSMPVPARAYQEFNELGLPDTFLVKDSVLLTEGGELNWTMNHAAVYGGVKAARVQDLVALEIIQANNWERPIYFAVTTQSNSLLGLDDYLLMEGMARRVVPVKKPAGMEYVNEPILREQVMAHDKDHSADYQPGMKFRGLNNPDIFFDENHERLGHNYRNAFIRLAIYYLNMGRIDKTIAVLDEMEETIPRAIIPLDYRLLFDVGNLYHRADAMDKYRDIAKDIEAEALRRIETDPSDVQSYHNPYRILLETYENLGRYEDAIGVLDMLRDYYPNDPTIQQLEDNYRRLIREQNGDTTRPADEEASEEPPVVVPSPTPAPTPTPESTTEPEPAAAPESTTEPEPAQTEDTSAG